MRPDSSTTSPTFSDLTAGNYIVRQVAPSGVVRMAPSAGFYRVSLGTGRSIVFVGMHA